MKTPFLAEAALSVEGTLEGHTSLTAAKPETSDEEPLRAVTIGHGSASPFLAGSALAVTGDVVGYSRLTRAAPETTDDPGYR